jgi:uncharacterized cupin superfamily protein
VIVRWDDVQMGQDIGLAAGALNVSLHRLEIAPEETAAQADALVEEIVFVLEGSGTWENGPETAEVRAGSCGVRLAQDQGHLLRAGKDGLTVLAFVSPIARKLFSGATTSKPNIVNLEAIEPDHEGESGKWVVVARKAGAVRAGLNWGHLEPGKSGAPPHLHSADEEVFVILEAVECSSSGLLPSAPRDRARRARDPCRRRGLEATEYRDRPLPPGRGRRNDVPRVRDAGAERCLLLPQVEQDLLAGCRPDYEVGIFGLR